MEFANKTEILIPKTHPEWFKKPKTPHWKRVKKAIKKHIKALKKEGT